MTFELRQVSLCKEQRVNIVVRNGLAKETHSIPLNELKVKPLDVLAY